MIFGKNQYYHIYNRGCNKGTIFCDETDYQKLISYIKTSNHSDYFELYAFALMPNHYHFFLKQISDKPVYKWFQYIFNQYVQYFNKRYNHSGTIFEGSFKTKIITNQKYFGLISHYIHSNPKSEFQKLYSSLSYLFDKSLIDLEFYNDNFGNTEKYLLSFNEYLNYNQNDEITDFIFWVSNEAKF